MQKVNGFYPQELFI